MEQLAVVEASIDIDKLELLSSNNRQKLPERRNLSGNRQNH